MTSSSCLGVTGLWTGLWRTQRTGFPSSMSNPWFRASERRVEVLGGKHRVQLTVTFHKNLPFFPPILLQNSFWTFFFFPTHKCKKRTSVWTTQKQILTLAFIIYFHCCNSYIRKSLLSRKRGATPAFCCDSVFMKSFTSGSSHGAAGGEDQEGPTADPRVLRENSPVSSFLFQLKPQPGRFWPKCKVQIFFGTSLGSHVRVAATRGQNVKWK